MNNKYIFPSHFHILKYDDYFKSTETNIKHNNKYALVNTKTKKVFIINKHIKDFLTLFRKSRKINNLKKDSTTVRFLFEMIKHNFLICENTIKFETLNKSINGDSILEVISIKKYRNISIISNSNDVTVALIENNRGHIYIYKYLKKKPLIIN